MDASIQKVSGIVANYPSQGGPKWFGQKFLIDKGVDPDLVARTILANLYEGRLATETCFEIADSVANVTGLELSWKESWELGRFLLSCLTHADIYRLDRGEEKGAYYVASTQLITHKPKENTTTQIGKPFPNWTSAVDRYGNRLIKPSSPQEKKTEWQPGPDFFSLSVLGGEPAPWIQAVHQLESTPYRINNELLNWAIKLDHDPATRIHPIPEAGRAYDPTRPWLIANLTPRDIRSRRQSFEEIIDQSNELKGETFYQRAFADYRGRLYLPDFSYIRSDFNRALIDFAEGIPMTEEGWDCLMLHAANVYGDNAGFEEKIENSKEQIDLFVNVANDPVSSFDLWSQADKPFCFLRACIEVRNLLQVCQPDGNGIINFSQFSTHLPCEIDQSNSAYQHIALIMNDEHLRKLSNLEGDYTDLYSTIANELDIPASAWEKRKIVKKVAIAWGYGASDVTLSKQLRKWRRVEPKAIYLRGLDWKEIFKLASKVRKTIQTAVPAVKEYQQEVSKVVRRVLKQGATELVWDTPMMFEVHQRVMETRKVRGDAFDGQQNIKLIAYLPIDEVNKREHRSKTPPNIVHSFDAAVLHSLLWNATYSGYKGQTQVSRTPLPFPVITIHDAFSAHAPNLPVLKKKLVEIIAGLYSTFDPFDNWKMLVGGQQLSRQISADWVENSRNAFS